MKKMLLMTIISLVLASTVFAGALFMNATYPTAVTGNKIGSAPKSATGKVTSILGLITTGDAGINTLAMEAGITEIYYVDVQVNNILGIVFSTSFTVYGE